jgi:predicted transcriptional regulator
MKTKKAFQSKAKTAEQSILEILGDGPLTWDEIQKKLHIDDHEIGFAIGELLAQKKLRTELRGETRKYHLRP